MASRAKRAERLRLAFNVLPLGALGGALLGYVVHSRALRLAEVSASRVFSSSSPQLRLEPLAKLQHQRERELEQEYGIMFSLVDSFASDEQMLEVLESGLIERLTEEAKAKKTKQPTENQPSPTPTP